MRAMRSISSARVDAEVGGGVLGARLLAEVDPAGQLAHDEQVGALDPLAPQRRGVIERRQRLDGAQVGVQAEPLAQPEQALLGTRRLRVGGVPLGAADGREQHRVGGAAGGERLVGERGAVGVDRGAAEGVLLELEVADGAQQLERRRHDLGADPVSGQRDDAVCHMAPLGRGECRAPSSAARRS